MAATVNQLNVLAADSAFRERIRTIVLQQAAAVYLEVGTTPNHATRVAFAVKLLGTPGLADQLVPVIVTRTNLVASSVTYDFDRRAPVTDATDGAILSQVATDWNMLAGV